MPRRVNARGLSVFPPTRKTVRDRFPAAASSATISSGEKGLTPQHHIIKETSETLSRLLQDEFKRNGYKRVHIVEQAPKPDAIDGFTNPDISL